MCQLKIKNIFQKDKSFAEKLLWMRGDNKRIIEKYS
jgi:hypothetical protein